MIFYFSVNGCSRGIKKLSAAPFNQGATGLKPKGEICDLKIVLKLFSNNVEIISYLHYTVFQSEASQRRLYMESALVLSQV